MKENNLLTLFIIYSIYYIQYFWILMEFSSNIQALFEENFPKKDFRWMISITK